MFLWEAAEYCGKWKMETKSLYFVVTARECNYIFNALSNCSPIGRVVTKLSTFPRWDYGST